jgi:hypothetical protein
MPAISHFPWRVSTFLVSSWSFPCCHSTYKLYNIRVKTVAWAHLSRSVWILFSHQMPTYTSALTHFLIKLPSGQLACSNWGYFPSAIKKNKLSEFHVKDFAYFFADYHFACKCEVKGDIKYLEAPLLTMSIHLCVWVGTLGTGIPERVPFNLWMKP